MSQRRATTRVSEPILLQDMSIAQISKLPLATLKLQLDQFHLPHGGNKAAIVKRLHTYLQRGSDGLSTQGSSDFDISCPDTLLSESLPPTRSSETSLNLSTLPPAGNSLLGPSSDQFNPATATARDHLTTDPCILKRDAHNTVAKPLITPEIRGTIRLTGVEADTPTSPPLWLRIAIAPLTTTGGVGLLQHHQHHRTAAPTGNQVPVLPAALRYLLTAPQEAGPRAAPIAGIATPVITTPTDTTINGWIYRYHVSLGMTSGVISLWCYHSCCGTI